MKKHIGKILAALIVIYLLVNMAAVITYPNQYKVIKTMGKISRVTTEPGFSLRIPLIQSETTISKARQLYDIAPTEIYTSDKKKMEVDAYIIWHVTDPIKFTQTLNSSTAGAESKISAMVYGALKATVSSTSQEELIASRDAALDKTEEDDALDVEVQDITSEDLKEETGTNTESSEAGSTGEAGTAGTGTDSQEQPKETEDGMTVIDENTRVISLSNKILEQLNKDYNPEQYGIEIQMVKIKKLDLPDENKDAVYNRMITERKNIAAARSATPPTGRQQLCFQKRKLQLADLRQKVRLNTCESFPMLTMILTKRSIISSCASWTLQKRALKTGTLHSSLTAIRRLRAFSSSQNSGAGPLWSRTSGAGSRTSRSRTSGV